MTDLRLCLFLFICLVMCTYISFVIGPSPLLRIRFVSSGENPLQNGYWSKSFSVCFLHGSSRCRHYVIFFLIGCIVQDQILKYIHICKLGVGYIINDNTRSDTSTPLTPSSPKRISSPSLVPPVLHSGPST